MSTETLPLAIELGDLLLSRHQRLTTAESCTGGLIAAAITDIPGSSAWFDQGIVTYANSSKVKLLNVPESVLAAFGAVSESVVEAMATGAISLAGAHLAIATSGVAGPGGGLVDKPIGTVCFAWCYGQQLISETCLFPGERMSVRSQAVIYALSRALDIVRKNTV